MRQVWIALIRGYQLSLSLVFGPCCRFSPSCSCYAMDAIREHGSLRGLVLAVRRILRCHPFHAGGFDPVPSPRAPLLKESVS